MAEDTEQMAIDAEESAAIEDMIADGLTDEPAGQIERFVREKFSKAETARRSDEERWIQAYRNYRGLYSPEVQFTSTEKSRVFVKVTKTKVLAAYGQLVEVLFGSTRFPLGINPTVLPEGVEDTVSFETNPQLKEALGDTNTGSDDERTLRPGETMPEFNERVGPLEDDLSPVEEDVGFKAGKSPSAVQFHPAMIAAKKMEKKIHDQLEESNAKKQLRAAAFEAALFGTGIMKGPFAVDKEYPNWDEEGEYNPVFKTVPQTSNVSIWNFYPDPDANNMDEAEYVIERHKMSRSQLRSLKRRPFFRDNAIDKALDVGENYNKEWWEHAMDESNEDDYSQRFEVLEFWGFVDREIIEQYDVDIPKELKDVEQLSVNVWLCNGCVLRLVMNPFTPAYLPYYATPYEMNPYNIFGVGIAENMDDTQTLMNGFMRMSVDNAALSGNLLIEVDETNLVPKIPCPGAPPCLLKTFPGYTVRSCPGTRLVSSTSINKFPDNAALSTDIRMKPFIKVCVSSMFSAIPTPKIL